MEWNPKEGKIHVKINIILINPKKAQIVLKKRKKKGPNPSKYAQSKCF
jgi:hypothetical protein